MKKYLSHWSAVRFWKVPFAEFLFEKELEAAALTEWTVFDYQHIYPKRGRKIHVCTGLIPETMKCSIEGTRVVSPELLFLQLSNVLDDLKLILLGICICAEDGNVRRKALSTKQRMKKMIEALSGIAGRRKAVRALKYVEDACCSPMEALLYMSLCLPYSLGGFGFKGATFNYEIKLTAENSNAIGKLSVFADIYFKQSRIVVEYNSKMFHDDPRSRRKDSERVAALNRQNYTVFSISSDQLYSFNSFRICAGFLASALGVRIRIRTRQHFEKQMKLRELFPRTQKPDLELP